MNRLLLLPALPFTVALVAGMVVEYFFPIVPRWLSLAGVAFFVVVGFLLLSHRRLRVWPVCLACVAAGIFFMTCARARLSVVLPAEPLTIEGTIVDTPRATAKRISFTFYVQGGDMDGRKIRVYVPKSSRVVLGGSYVVTGRLRCFNSFSPRFNYPRWAESQGLVAQMFVDGGHLRECASCVEQMPFFERVAVKSKVLRERLLGLFDAESISGEHIALVAAMAFGERSGLSRDTRDMFSRLGVAHLLALSGLHLGIIYTFLGFIFFRLAGRRFGGVVVVVSMWMYVMLVGMPVSALRAAIMLTIYTLLSRGGRGLSANVLFVAVAIMLIANPLMVWDVGFELSVVAVLSIAVFYSPIYGLISPKVIVSNFFLRAVWALVVVSISANLGSAPLVIYYFGYTSKCFLLTNLVAVPMVTLLLYGVFLMLVFYWLPLLRSLFVWFIRLCSTFLEWFLEALDGWVGGSVVSVDLCLWQMLVLYVGVVALAIAVRGVSRIVEERRRRVAI